MKNKPELYNVPWQIEHRKDGVSFIGYPDFWPTLNKMKFCWVGPFAPETAEFIFEAVKAKQESKPSESK